jgi:ankyrin repeat protein
MLLEEMSAFVDGAAPGWNGQSPLHVACAQQWDQGVELLIRHNANLNLRDDAGCTPLMVCVKLKATACMTLLLRSTRHFMSMEDSAQRRAPVRRSDHPLSRLSNGERLPYTVVDVPDKKGWTALHHAAACSDGLHAITMLSRHRVDINAVTKLGETALHIAAREGNSMVVRSLLSKQADTDIQDRYGRVARDVVPRDGSCHGLAAMLQTTAKCKPLVKSQAGVKSEPVA